MGTIITYILDSIIALFSLACIVSGEATIEDYVLLVGTLLFPTYDIIKRVLSRKRSDWQ